MILKNNWKYLLTFVFHYVKLKMLKAPVAQPDRVFGYEPKGQGFESLPAHHFINRFFS